LNIPQHYHIDLNLHPMKNLLILVVLIFGTGCFAQSIKISGLITDKNSGQPIAAASIKLPDGTGISSGTNGKFEIRITRLPIKLKIRHVSYQTKEIDLITDPKSLVRIELEELVSEIREVNISAQRLKNLTENEDFTLQDFAFDKNHLWLLGYMKNNPLRGRLWIADAFGDTITSIPVRKPEKLYTDLFGNVQLVMSDTVYQVYSDGKAMVFAYPYEKAQFFKTITPIKAIFAGKPVYQDYVHWKQGLHTYYYSQADQKSYFLNIARDSAEEVRQLIDYIYGENRWIINGKFARAIPIKFHQDSLLFDVLFRDLTYLTDPVSQRMYLLQRKTTAWKLNEFNPSAGRVGKQVQLPDFPGMSGITIYDHAVYFLYPEKKYPNYVRLYRYTI
jgi:hypothetical protein